MADKDLIVSRWQMPDLIRQPPAAVVFIALTQSGETAPVDALVQALIDKGMVPLPIFVASLKEGFSADLVAALLAETPPAVILNMTSFAVSDPAAQRVSDRSPGPFAAADAPVVQAMLASGTRQNWLDGMAGLNPRDLAMHVVLPELDGRITSRVVGFKSPPRRHALTQAMVTGYDAELEGCRLPPRWRRRGHASATPPRESVALP